MPDKLQRRCRGRLDKHIFLLHSRSHIIHGIIRLRPCIRVSQHPFASPSPGRRARLRAHVIISGRCRLETSAEIALSRCPELGAAAVDLHVPRRGYSPGKWFFLRSTVTLEGRRLGPVRGGSCNQSTTGWPHMGRSVGKASPPYKLLVRLPATY